MEMWRRLGLAPGVICAIGSGGKTSLLLRLAQTLPGTVIFCTTTKIFPPADMPVLCEADAAQLTAVLGRSRAVCVGTPTEEGKLTLPRLPLRELRRLADFVLVEGDGSRQLPLKAHGPGEPVIPNETDRLLTLVGASGFGRPIRAAAHRPERFALLASAGQDDEATPARVAAVLRAEGLGGTLVVNQADTPERLRLAAELAALLGKSGFAGEVRRDELTEL